MKDDAIAPVIAVMLILAVVVTVILVWNAVYIPSQKQASEIEHLRMVESAFLHFSSDIGDAVSARQDNLQRSEPVQLGGGDCLSSTLRSGGSLLVMDEPGPVYSLTLYDESLNPVNHVNGTLVNLSYEPVGNFWQDQGYRWQHGFINVTKHQTLQSPLDYSTMAEVNQEFNGTASLGTFARSFGSADYTINQSATGGNCSRIVLNAVRLSTSPGHPFVSGNGFGSLKLTSAVNTTRYDRIAAVSVRSDRSLFGNASLESWNSSFGAGAFTCSGTINYVPQPDESRRDYVIGNGKEPLDLILNDARIEIGVY
ncbi:hypothetical protein [uncultured Methanoregula sp.]|uniref:hypothetical protein n=1 Tax=uncultured Methanoregula sp. TaxID=1005933 RepID=UPI002AAB2F86|nr:hypothetical protein [uncultured Methanoregula sp.]